MAAYAAATEAAAGRWARLQVVHPARLHHGVCVCGRGLKGPRERASTSRSGVTEDRQRLEGSRGGHDEQYGHATTMQACGEAGAEPDLAVARVEGAARGVKGRGAARPGLFA